ncbi:MAG: DNA-3-methyladenine glycosylase [Candidatus Eisenbacteria bacterium]|nr:DNA-3-methyladenine glycosylase [Candidatus Eisenbacteria bacterium]
MIESAGLPPQSGDGQISERPDGESELRPTAPLARRSSSDPCSTGQKPPVVSTLRGDPDQTEEDRPRLGRSDFNRPTLQIARELLGKVIVRRMDGDRREWGRDQGDWGGDGDAGSESARPDIRALITEVEAYKGPRDLGSHAARGRRTPRVEPLYDDGGTVYVYLCYGMHWMLNFSTAGRERPEAVLIRGVIPVVAVGSPPIRAPRRKGAQRRNGANDAGALRRPARMDVRAPDRSSVSGNPRRFIPRGTLNPARAEVSGPGRVTRHLSVDLKLNRIDACSSDLLWVEDGGYHVSDRCVTRGPRVGIDYAGPYWASRPWRFRIDLPLWIPVR